jgi:hypothetical protein
MLFQAVMKFLSRLVEFKMLVNWGMVHCLCKKEIKYEKKPSWKSVFLGGTGPPDLKHYGSKRLFTKFTYKKIVTNEILISRTKQAISTNVCGTNKHCPTGQIC